MPKLAHALAAAAGNAGELNFEFVGSDVVPAISNANRVTIPTVQDGDLLVYLQTANLSDVTSIAGWTTIYSQIAIFDIYTGYKIATASDSGTTIDVTLNRFGAAAVMAFRPTRTVNNLYMRGYDVYNSTALASASITGANSPALVCAFTAGYTTMPSPSITETYYDATFSVRGSSNAVDFFYLLDDEAVTRSVTCTRDNGTYNRAFICRFDWD